jgi:hypothetical protein
MQNVEAVDLIREHRTHVGRNFLSPPDHLEA